MSAMVPPRLITAALAALLALSALPAAAQYIEKRSSTTYGAQTSTKPQPGPARTSKAATAKSSQGSASSQSRSNATDHATGQARQRLEPRR
jgi:hypothetical protein